MPSHSEIELSTSYLKFFSPTIIERHSSDSFEIPSLTFKTVTEAVKKVAVKRVVVKKIASKTMKEIAVKKYQLLFNEPVTLYPVYKISEIETKHTALYVPFVFESKKIAITDTQKVYDEVSTQQSSVQEEPEYFDYEVKSEKNQKQTNDEVLVSEVINTTVDKDVDNSEKSANQIEEIPVADLIAFDYSKAKEDVTQKQILQVSSLTSHTNIDSANKPVEHTYSGKSEKVSVTTQ
jgi:hypothetical protein